jgi:DNA-binding CsgD family transcriptional regulator
MGSDTQTPELVGRKRELAEIAQALDRAASGTQWALELVGEPGIGKSRLLAEACTEAEERDFLVLRGRAAEFEQDIPFAVLIDALNDHVESLGPAAFRGLDDDVLGELASILPALSGVASQPAAPGGAAQRYRAHYSIRALLERLSKSQPVMLALDDVHWADAASLEVVVHLLRRFRGGLLVAVAYRRVPTQLAAALEDAARAGHGSRLDLGPLTPDEAFVLLDPGLDAGVREAVYRDSGGNPFYLEQLGSGGASAATPVLLETERPRESRIAPPRVIAAITERLDRLAEGDRVVLEAAAVAGESFAPGVVASIAEVDDASGLAALDELARVDLVRAGSMPQRFEFRHPIVRRVVYDGMPAGWRVGAHGRAAAALAAAGAAKAEQAHHVARSAALGDERAIELLVTAAHEVAPRAPFTAGRLLLAAVRILPGEGSERRVQLLGEAGALLTSGGSYREALESLDAALSIAPTDAEVVRVDLIVKRAETRRRGGLPFASRLQLEQALRAHTGPDDATVLAARLELVMNRYWHGDWARTGELAEEALASAVAAGDPLLICHAASIGSLAASYRRQTELAADKLQVAESAWTELSDERLAERVYLNHYVGEAGVRLERPERAVAHWKRGVDVARMTGQDATARSWSGVAIYALLLKGRVAEAAVLAAADLDPEALDRDDWRQVWLYSADSYAALWRGDVDRALTHAREALTRAERSHSGTVFPLIARLRLGGALLAGADAAGAVQELGPLDTEGDRWLLDLDWGHGWDILIRARVARGELESAEEAVARAESRSAGLSQRTANLRCARAAVLLAGGDAEAAAQAAAEAAEIADSAGNPLLAGRCRVETGRALAASGRISEGISELERADRMLSECGAVREADSAARELRGLGKRVYRRPRAEREGGIAELSAREREVAAQVAEGKTNREIAGTLFLSEKTIESHLSRIYSKLDVHSRAALTAIVAREGAQAEGTSPTPTLS